MTQRVPIDMFVLAAQSSELRTAMPDLAKILPGPGADAKQVPAAVPVDLKTIDLKEGEEVAQMRSLAQAVYGQLQQAYLTQASNTNMLQTRFERAMEGLHRALAADRQARKDSGELVPRAELERDATTLASMLSQMREHMVRRVIERCPGLSRELAAEVSAAIDFVRRQETRIFQNLGVEINTEEDFLARLASS
jgi:hypothetical protein